MEIIEPDWYNLDCIIEMGSRKCRAWFKENVEPFNKLLAEGVEVHGRDIGSKHFRWADASKNHLIDCTHKALLINIQPIKDETAEDVLRYLLKTYDKEHVDNQDNWRDRARAVLKEQT